MTCDLAGGYGTLLVSTQRLYSCCCCWGVVVEDWNKYAKRGSCIWVAFLNALAVLQYYMNVSHSLIVADRRRIGVKGSVVGTTYYKFYYYWRLWLWAFPCPVPSHPPHRCAVVSDLLDGASQISIGVFWCRQGADSSQRWLVRIWYYQVESHSRGYKQFRSKYTQMSYLQKPTTTILLLYIQSDNDKII